MTTIVQVANANDLCQEYVRITSMLSMVQSGNYTVQASIYPSAGPQVPITSTVAPSQAALTGLLQARQTALANQLAAVGITVS